VWRGERFVVEAVEAGRRGTKVDRGEVYVKRHWFTVRVADGRRMTIYCERHARRADQRWWLYTIENGETREPHTA
jgi:hypothetical protein